MSKSKQASLSSSNGFYPKASGEGFAVTMKRESWQSKPQNLSKTLKDPILQQAAFNVQRNQDRKRLIQAMLATLDSNVSDDLDFKTTVNLQARQPQTVSIRTDDPFKVRVFTKTQNLMVGDEVSRGPNPPGVLHLRNVHYGGPYKKESQKDPVVMIQALARGMLQRKRYRHLKRQFEATLQQHRTFTASERVEKQVVIETRSSSARRRPSSSSRTSSTFLKPILKSDGLGIWETMHRKQTGQRLSSQSIEDVPDVQIVVAQKPPIKKKPPIPGFWQQPQQIEKSKSSDGYLEEEFEEAVSESGAIHEELVQSISESGIKESIIKESMAKGSASGIRESISMIKESISVVKESLVKESIVEDYGDDFEEASQSQPATLIVPKHIVKEAQDIDEYIEEEFDSYSEIDANQKKKSVTFDDSAQPSRALSPEPKVVSQPHLIETQPIQYVKPKWQIDEEGNQVLARKEAEFILQRFRNRYRELRKLELDEEEFSHLEKEHYDFLRVRRDVDNLIAGTGRLKADIGSTLPQAVGGRADLLFSKFQFEFHRLLSVNALGSKLQNIIGSIGLFDPQPSTTPNAPLNTNSVHRVLVSIEQQQLVVTQVLQQVMAQLNSLFVEQQAVSELRLYRQEMDQKLQQLLFKQDKLLNDRLETQLQRRDEDLKRFIKALFEKQRKDFGNVKLMPSHKLQEVLSKSISNFQAFQEPSVGRSEPKRKDSQKDDSSYQPDFEAASELSQQRSETSLSKESLANSMSLDQEVNDQESLMDIDWQNDINLFEKPIAPDTSIKDKQTQEIVDQLTKMLLEEIKKDLFPKRGVEPVATQIVEPEPIKQQAPTKQKQKIDKPAKQVVEPQPAEPPKVSKEVVKPVEDDFGMGKASFSRDDLEKEFDLTGDLPVAEVSEPMEKPKKVELKVDPAYQTFVKEIVERYAKLVIGRKTKVIEKILDLLEEAQDTNQTVGSLMARTFHFFTEREVKEKDALPIVQALEEQMGAQLLRIRNEYTTLLDRENIESMLETRFSEALSTAKATVLRITETLIPVETEDRRLQFEQAYQFAKRNPIPKECQPNYEVQDHLLQVEMDMISEEQHEKVLMSILEEVMAEFNSIGQKRRMKK